MQFQLERPNATKWDLKQAEMEEFRSVTDLFDMTGKQRSQMVNATLIQLYRHFKAPKVCEMIERWAMLGYHSLDSLVKLCSGEIPTERSVSKNVNEMPGKGRIYGSEPKSAKDLMPKTPEEFLNGKPAAIPKPKKRLPDGYFTEDLALEWMKQYHPEDFDLWKQDYFQSKGYDPELGEIFTLRKI